MINQSRRSLLKGMAYGTAALATGGVSAIAATADRGFDQSLQLALPSCDITIYQQQTVGKEMVSLMNLTDQVVRLDSIKPVGLEHINGSLVVKLNNVADGSLVLQPGERLAFEVEATSYAKDDGLGIPNVLAGYVNISSDHPAFNGKIPVTVFDSQVA